MLFEADADEIRAFTPRVIVFHAVVAALVLAAALSPPGRQALGVSPGFLIFGTAIFCAHIIEASRWAVAADRYCAPAAWWRRAISATVPVFYCATFAAPSIYPVPVTWVFTLMGFVAVGMSLRSLGLEHVPIVLSTTVGFHLVAAPNPTSLSIATASYVALLSGLTLWGANHFAAARRRASARITTAKAAAEAARAKAAKLSAAMALHDGLAGAIFTARNRIEADPSTAPMVLASLRDRTAKLLGSEPTRYDDLTAELDATPRPRSTRFNTTIRGTFASLSERERADIRFIALELLSNALRHRLPTSLTVEIVLDPVRTIEVTADGPLVQSEGTGRGGDHVALRAQCWNGTATLAHDEARSIARVTWPKLDPKPNRFAWLSGLAMPLATLAFLPLGWWGGASTWALGFTFVCVTLTGVGAAMQGLDLGGSESKIASFEAERAAAEAAAQHEIESLRVAIDELSGATDPLVAVAAFGSRVTSAMRALEAGAAS